MITLNRDDVELVREALLEYAVILKQRAKHNPEPPYAEYGRCIELSAQLAMAALPAPMILKVELV